LREVEIKSRSRLGERERRGGRERAWGLKN